MCGAPVAVALAAARLAIAAPTDPHAMPRADDPPECDEGRARRPKNVGGCSWPGGTAAAGVAIGLKTLNNLFARARNEAQPSEALQDEGAHTRCLPGAKARARKSERARARCARTWHSRSRSSRARR